MIALEIVPRRAGRYAGPNRRVEPDTSWMEHGACFGAAHLADLFYPPDKGKSVESYAKARRICAVCTVRDRCRDYAVEVREPLGMWGGTTPKERRAMRRAAATGGDE